MRYLLVISILVLSLLANAQEKKEFNLEISGMVSAMPSFSFHKINEKYSKDFLLHNRIDLEWTYDNWLVADIGLRNRFMIGDKVKNNNLLIKSAKTDQGFMDLTANWLSKHSYFINSAIDRLSLQATLGELEITIGRQRINWGISTAWNPNDIFNAYSFFDFNYVKRAGTDAVRIKYFTSFTSLIEIAASVDANNNINLAAYNRFNIMGSDIQFSSGIFKSEDIYAGAG